MDHNKQIAAAAKAALGPLGLRREGRSRRWYDDHGWWAIAVEFQPSSWDRGTYLNVGLSWMLYEKSAWTFDIGYRVSNFRSATRTRDFSEAASDVAAEAADKVLEIRRDFTTLEQMRTYYRDLEPGDPRWPNYYAGVLAGLDGDESHAEERFTAVLGSTATHAWEHALHHRCRDLIRLLPNREWFRDSVRGILLRCRAARCLEDGDVEAVQLP